MSFLEDLASISTLKGAWQAVASKRGMAGIDRVGIGDFASDLDSSLRRLADEIASGRYRTLPVLRIRPRFLAAASAPWWCPPSAIVFVQRAISGLLSPKIDPDLPPACRAFRKGASARAAADDVDAWISEGSLGCCAPTSRHSSTPFAPSRPRALAAYVDPDGLHFLDRLLRQKVYDHDQISDMVGHRSGLAALATAGQPLPQRSRRGLERGPSPLRPLLR